MSMELNNLVVLFKNVSGIIVQNMMNYASSITKDRLFSYQKLLSTFYAN